MDKPPKQQQNPTYHPALFSRGINGMDASKSKAPGKVQGTGAYSIALHGYEHQGRSWI